jgi:hypothetical protein
MFRTLALLGGVYVLVACSASSKPGVGATPRGGGGTSSFNPVVGNGGNGAGVTINVDGGNEPGDGPCIGYLCQVDDCSGHPEQTTLSATVYDPAGQVPLYDVAVYVPNAAVSDINTGPTCDNCATPQAHSR